MVSTFQNHEADDLALRQRRLSSQKWIATGLLALAVAIFLATLWVPEAGFWILLIRAASEAGVVGGLADWFAVTALFRHPLGIPIPHTALISRNKDRIGSNLGTFFARHFMTEEVVLQKLRSMDLAERIGNWLSEEQNATFFANYVFDSLPSVLNSLDDEEIRRLINETMGKQIQSIDLSPVLSSALDLIVQNNQHRHLLDKALNYIRESLSKNRASLTRLVIEQSRWWVPRSIDQEMARLIVDATLQLLEELNDEDHEVRHRFNNAAAELINDLEHSPELRAQIEGVKQSLMNDVDLHILFGDLWTKIKKLIVDQTSDATSPNLLRVTSHGLVRLGRRLKNDGELRQRMNTRIESLIIKLVLPWRVEIGQFIAEVVHHWDTNTLCNQIELEVGRDLQFIRINGSLVGSLVGAILFLIMQGLT